jgi:2-oxoglutarate dehydrogenase E2 component (dihydrolipoamide succinyltransferase)
LLNKKARGQITVDDMTGGTFLLSLMVVFWKYVVYSIINPPQSAILGMHNIERPIAVSGKIHPMMYVALSYDHRIIDGKESVGF